MQQSTPRSATVFRACVVNAVRDGEDLMQKLVQIARETLARQEAEQRDLARRDLMGDALRLLNQHEAALLKGYPMALLEVFADGPGAAQASKAQVSGLDFGELSLVDDDEVQAQVELSRAQQLATHETEAVLSVLNGLVSAAQGLRRVHPERNPLRPENYIRALQRVIADAGVAAPIREVWMQPMRMQLGKLLVQVYQRAVENLRKEGVQAVGFGAAPAMPSGGQPPRGAGGASMYGGAYGAGPGSQWGGAGPGSGYAPPAMSGYGPPAGYAGSAWAHAQAMPAMAPEAEEALLTVGILRQMLAGGDPFQAPAMAVPAAMPPQVGAAPQGGYNTQGAPISGHYVHPHAAAAEAMEDIAELERLVGRLAGSNQPGYVPSGHSAPHSLYGVSYAPAEAASPALAGEVVARMVENIARDSRLLPPVQRAVQSIEPAIRKLVRHDVRFFSDANHPARRLLDEVTQRSLAYGSESAAGFRGFMRLVEQAVQHLALKDDITSPAPFDAVLKALETAWEKQEKKYEARREAEKIALEQTEQRELLAQKIASNIAHFPGVEAVPSDILAFATGPWAQVAALAQVSQTASGEGDPGGYLALIPELFWSVQPELVGADKDRLVRTIPAMLAKLREGLKSIQHPAAQTSALIERLVLLHQQVLDAVQAQPEQAPAPSVEASSAQAQEPDVPLPEATDLDVNLEEVQAPESQQTEVTQEQDPFYIGAWVDLVSNGKVVRTQLTWVSPHKTLFLFTGADGSSQSMTRRMRDKLAAEGLLRILPRQHVVDGAISALAASSKRRRSSTRK